MCCVQPHQGHTPASAALTTRDPTPSLPLPLLCCLYSVTHFPSPGCVFGRPYGLRTPRTPHGPPFPPNFPMFLLGDRLAEGTREPGRRAPPPGQTAWARPGGSGRPSGTC